MKNPHYTIVATGVSGFLVFITGIGMGWFGFPAIIVHQVKSGVLLTNNTEAYDRWKKLPLAMQFNVYFFNVTNPDDVLQGAEPILTEIGPYAYEQYREKYEIEEGANDTLSYYQNSTFYFNKEKSGNLSEDDELTLLNVALLGTALKVKRIFAMGLTIMGPLVPQLFTNDGYMFLKGTARQHLWDGVTVVNCTGDNVSTSAKGICRMMKPQLPPTVVEDSPGIFSMAYFRHKNNTHNGRFRINRGLTDDQSLGHIEEWNDETELSLWGGDTCNQINGTDSTIFPPFWTPKKKLYIFVTDVCRSLYAVYDKEVKYKGVPAMHYVGSPHNLQDANEYAPNKCFCQDNVCLKTGAIDVMPCVGVPLIMTFPHFFNASPDYQHYVKSMKPNKSKHETYIDLEAKTGVPLRGFKRMQLNMFLTKFEEIEVLNNVSEGLFPTLWLEEGVELEGKNLAMVQELYTVLYIFDVVKWILVAAGVILMCISIYVASAKRNVGVTDITDHHNRVMVSYDNKGYLHKPDDVNDTLSMAAINDIINNDQNENKRKKSDMFPGKSHSNRTNDSVGLGNGEVNKSAVTLSNVFM